MKFCNALFLAAVTLSLASALGAQVHLSQSVDPFTIQQGLAPSCNNSGGTTGTAGGVAENSFWRAYNLATVLPNTTFRVEAFRVGFDLTGDAPNSFECKLYTIAGAFPGGTLTQVGTTQSVVEPSAGAYTASIQIFPLDTPVTFAANSTIVMEFKVLNGQATAADFWPGANSAGQTAIGYIQSVACSIPNPVDIKSVGAFPNANLVLDLLGNGPEMDVQRPAGTSIADGGNHGIGNVNVAGVPFTFTIANTGVAALALPGSAVTVAAVSGNPNVTVTTPPPASIAGSGGTGTFVVTVVPSGNGAFSFTVSIASGTSPLVGLDFNENPYNFTVDGTGVGAANTPPAISVPTGSGWVNAGAGLFTLTLTPGTTFANALEATDSDNNPMTTVITNPTTSITGLTVQPSSVGTPTTGPLNMNWGGNIDPTNAPGNYDWGISVNDGTANTVGTARIIIVDVVTAHAASSGTGGDGSAGNPYTRGFVEADTPAVVFNLCTVTDANTGQTLTLTNVQRTGGTATGSGSFTFQLSAGVITVNPTATLVIADVGTYIYTMDIEDGGTDAPVTINALIDVTAIPTNVIPVVSVPGGSAWVNAGGNLFTLTVQPGAAFNASLSASDPDSDLMTVVVTNPGSTITGLTNQPTNIATPTAGPIGLNWAGTADPGNTPGPYNWTVAIDDGVTGTRTITARIIIVDVAPQHAIQGATGGVGTAGSPYTVLYTETMGATSDVDVASITDANTSQSHSVTGVSPSTTFFNFAILTGSLNLAPNGALPTAAVGVHNFDVSVFDGGANTISIFVRITVAPAPNITTTSPLTGGEQGLNYNVTITATGGTGALTFSATTALPAGLSITGGGLISGTPQVNGPFNFTIRVTDSLGVFDDQAFNLTLNPPSTGNPAITTSSPLPGGQVNQAYTPFNFAATGGTGIYSFAVTSGTLPPGMNLSPGGTLGGTPGNAAIFNFTVTVTDSAFATGSAAFSLTVQGSGSNNGGSGSSGGGCTGADGNTGWLALLGLIAVAGVATRLRTRRS